MAIKKKAKKKDPKKGKGMAERTAMTIVERRKKNCQASGMKWNAKTMRCS